MDRCYHHTLSDKASTEKLVPELKVLFAYCLERQRRNFHDVMKQVKASNTETDVHHIDYEIPENNPAKKSEYSHFITMILQKGMNAFEGPPMEFTNCLQDRFQHHVLGSEK